MIKPFCLAVDVAQLDHAVIVQSAVGSRWRGISACVKGGVTQCKHWFL